ncbi:hypothetical protein [Microbacterium maritypicum]
MYISDAHDTVRVSEGGRGGDAGEVGEVGDGVGRGGERCGPGCEGVCGAPQRLRGEPGEVNCPVHGDGLGVRGEVTGQLVVADTRQLDD